MSETDTAEYNSNPKAFALYRLPETTTFNLITNFPASGKDAAKFLFHPFDTDKTASIEIRGSHEILNIEELLKQKKSLSNLKLEPSFNMDRLKENEYKSLVNKALHSIQSNELRKVVLSRSECRPRNPEHEPIDFFINLCDKYPQTFNLLFHHPEAGTWLMASPEILVSRNERYFKTMALAATWPANDGAPKWSFKEFEEQGMVLQFILLQLKGLVREMKVSERYTRNAGPVNHLCNDLSFKSELSPEEIAALLHPTPAIAGLPREESLQFIRKFENYDRSYYTGFSGPVLAKEAHLFVNLRCLQVFEDSWVAYSGGGLVEGSDAENEWKETEYKLRTLWSVLEKM